MATIRLTQEVIEVLTVDAESLGSATSSIRVAQLLLEMLTVGPQVLTPSAVAASWSTGTPNVFGLAVATLTAQVVLVVSSVSVVNAIGHVPLTVSAEWRVCGGAGPLSYHWSFEGVSQMAGFASTATTSSVTRTYTTGGGSLERHRVSARVVDVGGVSTTSAFYVHVRARRAPSEFDGKVVIESQRRRRVFPN